MLLLNEPDQFLSTRIEGGANGGEKMHNQMQNIFLEQIEKFEGVLIATTNFLQGLDRAFSRRFEYKVEFTRPKFEERVLIWRNALAFDADFDENLSVEELAKFELSGAQIMLVLRNIALKVAAREEAIFKFDDFYSEIIRELNSEFDNDGKKVGLI